MPNLPFKEVTIYDLARQLNVSAATISRALQNNPSVSKKTRKRIQELAEKALTLSISFFEKILAFGTSRA